MSNRPNPNFYDILCGVMPDFEEQMRNVHIGIRQIDAFLESVLTPAASRKPRRKRVAAPKQARPRQKSETRAPQPPPGNAPQQELLSLISALAFLSEHSGIQIPLISASKLNCDRALKLARRKFHPDNQDTGDRQKFDQALQAHALVVKLCQLGGI